MAKAKNSTIFFCKECGYESSKWMGQCPACKEWNSFVEEPVASEKKPLAAKGVRLSGRGTAPVRISEIALEDQDRTRTGFLELDRVLGDGIVKGSLVLVGGDPGIGKSTLLLQVCRNLAAAGKRVLYISGEESLKQIKLRANRIGEITGELFFLCETNLDTISGAIEQAKPDIVVIDSIQTMYREDISSAPGSVSQVRESTNLLLQTAKGLGIAIFIVGHVTKEGVVAGPRVLEHMVDTVLYFEGDRQDSYRILRAVKNRFGSTNEIGVFEMMETGLSEVANPSEMLLSGRPKESSGAVVACSLEGTRPILLEVQALVTATNFGMARRTANGVDYNRINILLAILEKRCGYAMSRYDAYVNIAGGMKMNEPALDLALVMALVSSYKNREVDSGMLIFGEVGLSGEVRGVSQAAQRVAEAVKMGFSACVLPKANLAKLKADQRIRLIGVDNVREAIGLI
ncbi:MAG: DNA repair protein RadA [Lachnospiraceae bacterium]|nr:DNA repair protein RadA [Lachnospiraceae bacterium]